ncbi:MAG TPA: pantetheine-phosphate adenylyltransferase [Acidimicrobiia bacterium]|nr:pantetheine-phosphate adenylyltransferase [Acidimicrobiia bacterium]
MIISLVPGSFDPPTKGHLDVIERCTGIFDRVVVGVVHNPSKSALFTAEERVDLLTRCCAEWTNVHVESFEGLLVDFAKRIGAKTVIKGLRAVTDFDYEIQMSQMNRHLSSDVVSLFVATKPEYGYLSSSLVKEVARLGGSVEDLVPPIVSDALKERLG